MRARWSYVQTSSGTLALICSTYGAVCATRPAMSLALLGITREYGAKGLDVSGPLAYARVADMNARINASGMLTYAVGKLVGGVATDIYGGRRVLCSILVAISACFAHLSRHGRGRRPGFSFAATLVLSRFLHAAAWPAVTLVIRGVFDGSPGQTPALSLGAASGPMGALFGSLLGGLVLARTRSWRMLLACTAAATALFCALSLTFLPPRVVVRRRRRGSSLNEGTLSFFGVNSSRKKEVLSAIEALREALATPKLLLLYGSNAMLTATYEFGTLLPQFLADEYALDDAAIGSVASAAHLAAPPAILVGGWAANRLEGAPKAAFVVGMELVAVSGFLVLSRRPPQRALAPALMAVSAGAAPAFYCVAPGWVLRWAGPHAAFFSGLSDAPGNFVTVLLYMLVPRLLAHGGWPRVMRLYALQVALSALCLTGHLALESVKPTKNSPFVRDRFPRSVSFAEVGELRVEGSPPSGKAQPDPCGADAPILSLAAAPAQAAENPTAATEGIASS